MKAGWVAVIQFGASNELCAFLKWVAPYPAFINFPAVRQKSVTVVEKHDLHPSAL